MRIVILGAGFGGLELASCLSERLGDDAQVVLIDQSDGFIFGFSKHGKYLVGNDLLFDGGVVKTY